MLHICLLYTFISLASTQTSCTDAGVGPCLNFLCDTGFTCITAVDTCCAAANVISASTVTTSATISTACVDKLNPRTGTSDCPSRANLCNNAVYYTLMTQQCPRTCGRCSSASVATSSTCVDRVNPRTGTSDCPARAAYCNNNVYYTIMTQQCPKTCGRCTFTSTQTAASSTCMDKLNPSTGVSDCPARKRAGYCSNPVYYAVMTDQCPYTCGRCTGSYTTSTATCVDRLNPRTGVSDCPSRAYLCNNSVYSALMTQQCPATCGRCTSTTTGGTGSSGTSTTAQFNPALVDKVNPATGISDCPAFAHLCENALYYDLMTEQCPVTCGRIGVTDAGSSSTCVDKVNPNTGTSNCASIASFCNNSVYFNLMTQQCPATCGRCNGAVTATATTSAVPTTTTTLPFIQTLACPTGWHLLVSTLSCYMVGDGAKTFSLAEADCQTKGGSITSIHSFEENEFVRTTTVRQWIGLTDFGNVLVNNDGTPVDYTHWDAGEPNDLGQPEECVVIESDAVAFGMWNDIPCDLEYTYVCKIQAVPL